MIINKQNKGIKGEIIRNRTIRPSTRDVDSKSYKIDTKAVSPADTLTVNINHESTSFFESYKFSGSSVANKNSISFRVNDYGNRIDITWSGANPIGLPSRKKNDYAKEPFKNTVNKAESNKEIEDGILQSFEPIYNENTQILILGTMPGAESLAKRQYYANPRNLFWKLLGNTLTIDFEEDYSAKTNQLLEHGIGLWDVCMSCIREGSLDTKIEDVIPNDLTNLITKHPHIKAIAFNGKESAKLFGKHFSSISGIKLLVLPSSSPANAAIPYEEKLSNWSKIKDYLQ